MRKWLLILAVLAVLGAGVFVASVSLWTRNELYAASVSDFCIGVKRMDQFRNGQIDPKQQLAQIAVGGHPHTFTRVEQFEYRVVRRLGFFFLSHEEQLSFIAALPTCSPASRANRARAR